MPPLMIVTQTAVNCNMALLLSVVADNALRCSSSREGCFDSYCCRITEHLYVQSCMVVDMSGSDLPPRNQS